MHIFVRLLFIYSKAYAEVIVVFENFHESLQTVLKKSLIAPISLFFTVLFSGVAARIEHQLAAPNNKFTLTKT